MFAFMTLTFTADADAAQVSLAWDGAAGSVSGYRLFTRTQAQTYDYASPTWDGTTNTCTLDGLDESAIHYFVVRAYDSQGNESTDSNEVMFRASSPASIPAQTSDPVPPDLPTALTPAGNAQGVALEPELVTSPFKDPTAGDYHTNTRWQVFRSDDDVLVFDLYSNIYLTRLSVPPLVLDGGGAYYWTAQHYNQAGAGSPPASSLTFSTADRAADADADGVPDSQEIAAETDLDRDGRSDGEQADMIRFLSVSGDQKIGLQASAASATVRLEAAQSVDASTVSNPKAFQPSLPVGLYNFKITLDQPGESVMVKIHFSNQVNEQNHFYMFDPAMGYIDFGTAGLIAPDGQTAAFTFQDGGEGDMDGVENGIIVSLGGYGSTPPPQTAPAVASGSASGGGGGGGGCFISTLLNP
ncbi:MAG: fibronectin type III domain-containing protein [Desulfobacteraceae bacterium]|nr:MAG: fibronectin type III domain-containing protein [Desulfobacteraceae bacterium]